MSPLKVLLSVSEYGWPHPTQNFFDGFDLHESLPVNDISIGSTIFAHLTCALSTDRHPDTQTNSLCVASVATGRTYALQCGPKHEKKYEIGHSNQ